jgi:hypothetical protein
LITALLDLGYRPTTVLDIGGGAAPRLDRLLARIQASAFSIHDLSRVEISGRGRSAAPRFNMPFELGLAVAVARGAHNQVKHAFALLEDRPFRLQRSLSDMNGYDPRIHGGTCAGAVRSIFEIFSDSGTAAFQRAQQLAIELTIAARQLRRAHRVATLFSRTVVGELVQAATVLQVARKR